MSMADMYQEELRSLHNALMQQPNNLRFPSASAVSHHLSAQDYPVFTPTYDDEPLPGYHQILLPKTWGEHTSDRCNHGKTMSDYGALSTSSRMGFSSGVMNLEGHDPVSRSCSMGDITTCTSSCNKCKPAIITGTDPDSLNNRKSTTVVPLTDSHSSLHAHTKHKLLSFSRLFPRLNNLRMSSVEMLKRELTEANESRDVALLEAAETKSLMVDLRQKLEYLEAHCEELKRALRPTNLQKRGFSTEEVMMETFLQIVSEARLSATQFCKTLADQMEETDRNLVHSLNSNHSRAVLYHLEAIINQTLYQDFENPVFRRNGAAKFLDPEEDREARFQSFVGLKNLSWNEVLRKGTKYYSEEFSRFCDEKMSGIIASLGWSRSWPEQLLQAFFVAAKCVWLLHLLAFSFSRPLDILRVEENMGFEAKYMEDVCGERQGFSRVKIMVMPGFHVGDRVVKCKVLCRHKSGS